MKAAVATPSKQPPRVNVEPVIIANLSILIVYRALVIGNNNCQDPKGQWQVLETAVAEAQSVSQLLKADDGFTDATLLTDASKREMINALADLAKRTQADDSLVVLYCAKGHEAKIGIRIAYVIIKKWPTKKAYKS